MIKLHLKSKLKDNDPIKRLSQVQSNFLEKGIELYGKKY